MGKRVPEDIKVVGFDNIFISQIFSPSLSTISLSIEKEGLLYIDYFVGKNNGKNLSLDSEYIERDSTSFNSN